jgi:DNA transformation protein
MMAVSEEYLGYILDQLAGFGDVVSRRMFGGAGLYRDGMMFALIAGDVLYLKVDDSNRADYEATGRGPFQPYRDRKTVLPYYEVPVDVVENRDELAAWAEKAYAVALRTRRERPLKRRTGGLHRRKARLEKG